MTIKYTNLYAIVNRDAEVMREKQKKKEEEAAAAAAGKSK